MIKTRNIVTSINDVDVSWLYKHFLNLPSNLTGSNIMIKSPLKGSEDWEPSFSIYKKPDGEYKWHDLSTGLLGDIIELVRLLKSKEFKREITRGDAFGIIKETFKAHLEGNELTYEKTPSLLNRSGKVIAWEARKWNDGDKAYWGDYGIDFEILEEYNVCALSNFTINKVVDGIEKDMIIRNPIAYAYCTNKGELAKVYQPKVPRSKFLKVSNYLQGSDQLKYNVPNLIITSSTKDGLSFMKLNIEGFEFCSPDSENTLIKKETIDFLKTKYSNIQILFDTDEAGIASALKYKEKYELESIYLDLEKDISDSISIWGQEFVKLKLMQLL